MTDDGRMELNQATHEEVASLTPGLEMLGALRAAGYGDARMTWVLPRGFLADATMLWGRPVLHSDVPEPLLAFRVTRP
jgi:hypothetical protein